MLARLIDQIREQEASQGVDVRICIYDDHSDELPNLTARWSNLTAGEPSGDRVVDRYWRARTNHGKRHFWRIVNNALLDGYALGFDYFYLLQDDLQLRPDFFERSIRIWDGIWDPQMRILNPLITGHREGRGLWGAEAPDRFGFDGIEVWRTQWTDCIFMASPKLEQELPSLDPVPQNRWTSNGQLSSGVGKQISRRLREAGCTIYQVTESLVHHGDHESLMNPWRNGDDGHQLSSK